MKRKDIRKLDNEFRKMIRTGKPCMKCGNVKSQASHVIPVSTCGYGLRWNKKNAIPLCYRCHIHGWHKSPIDAMEWFRKKFGPMRILYLMKLKRESDQYKYITPEEVRASWRDI